MVYLSDKLKDVVVLKNFFKFYEDRRFDCIDVKYLTKDDHYINEIIMGFILKNKDHLEEMLKYEHGFTERDFDFGVGIREVSRSRFITNFENVFFEVVKVARKYVYWKQNGPIAQRERQ